MSRVWILCGVAFVASVAGRAGAATLDLVVATNPRVLVSVSDNATDNPGANASTDIGPRMQGSLTTYSVGPGVDGATLGLTLTSPVTVTTSVATLLGTIPVTITIDQFVLEMPGPTGPTTYVDLVSGHRQIDFGYQTLTLEGTAQAGVGPVTPFSQELVQSPTSLHVDFVSATVANVPQHGPFVAVGSQVQFLLPYTGNPQAVVASLNTTLSVDIDSMVFAPEPHGLAFAALGLGALALLARRGAPRTAAASSLATLVAEKTNRVR
ncbi:MAG TPA: hypothetical protein VMR31_00590 [Myxococcota bacterium]|nr:hypothetical protein [Myxococcota bacterium]